MWVITVVHIALRDIRLLFVVGSLDTTRSCLFQPSFVRTFQPPCWRLGTEAWVHKYWRVSWSLFKYSPHCILLPQFSNYRQAYNLSDVIDFWCSIRLPTVEQIKKYKTTLERNSKLSTESWLIRAASIEQTLAYNPIHKAFLIVRSYLFCGQTYVKDISLPRTALYKYEIAMSSHFTVDDLQKTDEINILEQWLRSYVYRSKTN